MIASEQTPDRPAAEVASLQTRLRWLTVVVCLLGVVIIGREGVTRNRLAARSFALVDETGAQRGLWRTWGADSRLVMQDTDGTWRINLHVAENGYTATMFGPGESTELRLSTADDAPSVTMAANGNQVTLSIDAEGTLVMTTAGADGAVQEWVLRREQR